MGNFGLAEILVLAAVLAVFAWPGWQICKKTGNSGLLGIGLLIPMVNIAIWLYLAFSEWPIERELKALRARAS